MGSIDSHIAAVLGGQAYQAAQNASSPQPQAASPVPPAREVPAESLPNSQQDRVSLSGTTPPPQQQQGAPRNGPVGPAAFTRLAQVLTLPPDPHHRLVST